MKSEKEFWEFLNRTEKPKAYVIYTSKENLAMWESFIYNIVPEKTKNEKLTEKAMKINPNKHK